MTKLLSISIISNAYNSDLEIFKQSLESIKRQKYPNKLIEHIVVDAGSTNGAIELAKSYGCLVIERPDLLYGSQERMSLGIKRAKNELILILETDNILIGNDWLKEMVRPFIDNEDIVCTFSMYNGFKKNMPALTRYFALLGTNDAFLYYLDKVEKMPLDEKGMYNKGKVFQKKSSYYIVGFNPPNLPPMGDNGFMVRRDVIKKFNKKPSRFIHVDAFADMVRHGYNRFGVVDNSIMHYAGGNILKQYKSRTLIKHLFYDELRKKRTYFTFDPRSPKDVFNLVKFIIFSLTFIAPLFRSIKGYLKIRDTAWFLHPVVCFVALFMYTMSEISFQLRKLILHKFCTRHSGE